jgi:L-rhamnose isomerase/sugar isomerase
MLTKETINLINQSREKQHLQEFESLAEKLTQEGIDVNTLLGQLEKFQIAVPSWALGAGGTRFGRFAYGGAPRTLLEKIEDVGLLHALTKNSNAISLHIPWDIPKDIQEIKEAAIAQQLSFDAVNSNTFQDQVNQKHSYKYGSLSHADKAVREQAIAHNKEVIQIGESLGSKSITVWLADGSNFPGQNNFQKALQRTQDSLQEITKSMPKDWRLFIEYKPYEPHFYSTVIQDWGTSFLLANACGPQAFTLVDLGHHLPNTNIEQIVATLLMQGKLGGFHFNDSKYGDDDLTVGSIQPYKLFLIFNELVYGMATNKNNPPLAWMIDASHNTKDSLEDLLQSIDAILESFAKALLVDQKALHQAQQYNDVVMCQEFLQNAFKTDVRPLIREMRLRKGGALDTLKIYRETKQRQIRIQRRGANALSSGL